MRLHRSLLAAVAATLIVASCGSSGGSGDSDPADSVATAGGGQVGIKGSRFDPLDVTISAGESVTFTNNDPFAHTVTSNDSSPLEFDSDRFSDGETFVVTFDDAGTYEYFCQIHPTMRAAVTVV